MYKPLFGDYVLCISLETLFTCEFCIKTLLETIYCCWLLYTVCWILYNAIGDYIYINLSKCRDLKENRKNSGVAPSLPSAGSRQRTLPSAGGGQRGHVAPSCAI